MIPAERRFQPRLPFHARGMLILFPRFVDAVLLDYSLHGARILLGEGCAIETGERCALRILSPEGRQLIEIEAACAHRDTGPHLGLAFRDVTPGVERALRAIYDMNLGTDSMLNRDLRALLQPVPGGATATIGREMSVSSR